MQKIRFVFLISMAMLAGNFIMVFGQSPSSFPLPKNTGAYREDMIAVAESQVGYEEAKNGEAVYAEWAGMKGSPWCAHFIAWCAHQAGVPGSIIPLEHSSCQYRKFYSDKGRYYILNNGQNHRLCQCRALSSGTISLNQIEPGDILMIETNGNFSDGPDHTCLAVAVKGGVVRTIDGNYSDRVMRTVHTAAQIHGICKPAYSVKIDEKSVALSSFSFVYSGREIRPGITVRVNGTILKAKKDYTVSYTNNINAGTAAVTVAGKGNYEGSVKLNFKIQAKSINETTVQKISNQVYTGNAIRAKVAVRDGKKSLVQGSDYTVSYKNNKSTGKASVTIKGKKNYKGSRKVYFQIIPNKVEGLAVKSNKKGTADAAWKKNASAGGYLIQYSSDSKFRKNTKTITVKGKSARSKRIKPLGSGKTYYFRICAYKVVDGKKIKGSYSRAVKLVVK